MKNRVPAYWVFVLVTMGIIGGCANTGPALMPVPAGVTVPTASVQPSPMPVLATPADTKKPVAAPNSTGPGVLLYISPATKSYFAQSGIDVGAGPAVWGAFLSKYKIPFVVSANVAAIEQMAQSDVLLLPTAAALTQQEMAAIEGARLRGISVLSTWLTGVRDETGTWRGFDFMERVLGVRVVGNTATTEDDVFMIMHGDSPIAHSRPAGTRVWTERSQDFLPLRLEGNHYAAQIMDWSRSFSRDKQSGLVVFDEKKTVGGQYSRNVVFGYSENAWTSASPLEVEALAHNALAWLFRQPDAYLAAWPFPHKSAVLIAVQGGEELMEVDYEFAKDYEAVGGRATFFLLPETISNSSGLTKRIQKRGHEIAYSGDKFTGFKGQSRQVQGQRLDSMKKSFDDLSIPIFEGGGFYAPLDSYDKNTEDLLMEKGFNYFLAAADSSESRLPHLLRPTDSSKPPLVVLPRTQPGPEDHMERGDPREGLQTFVEELDQVSAMGGLSVVRLPAQTILTENQLDQVFGHLKERQNDLWMRSASEISRWWRERAAVEVRLEPNAKGPLLVVSVSGTSTAPRGAMVLVNVPNMYSRLRLEPADLDDPVPPVVKIDDWRMAVGLGGLQPGEYCWYLNFETQK